MTSVNPTTPMRAIRAQCLECAGGSPNEVKLCRIERCPLWRYRFGKRPTTARPDQNVALRPGVSGEDRED